jgi:Kelch motif
MAQTTQPALSGPRTLPAPRRRALFGLFDADGWSWASVKAVFWFVLIILLLGYVPDRAYYFTVQQTVDIGLLAWSPVNFCPPGNETLPCPAPQGATLPWHPSPAEIQLPAARTDGVVAALGTTYLYAGGSDGKTATADVYVSHAVPTGNLDKWSAGPPLPAPRSGATSVVLGSTLYVIGGLDASGAPTATVYSLTVANDGTLGMWMPESKLTLPGPRAGASAVALSDGFVVMGGSDATGPTKTVWRTQQAATAFGAWTVQAPLFEENVDGVAVNVGGVISVIGGRNASGKPVATVQQGLVGGGGATAADPNLISAYWRSSAQTNLPSARTNAAAFTANGAIYVVGGSDGTGPRTETWWATPDANGVIPAWNNLRQTDLGQGVDGAAPFTAGSFAFIVGGRTPAGLTGAAARANLAPALPFFQVGILGATIPALKLTGDIGQQLGYLAAAGAGTVDFVGLLLVGWAFAHKERVREIVAARRRRRG